MLRESGKVTGKSFDLKAIVDSETIAGGVEHGDLLNEFVDAVLTGSADDAANARRRVRDAIGDAAYVDACATIASFNAVVKIADGSGIPLEDIKAKNTKELRESLGIEKYRANRN
jgi:hypothetical protein